MQLKLVAMVLLGYLLYGTVAGDWWLGGETTKYGWWMLAGAAAVFGLFALGIRVARAHLRFLGFSLIQWSALPPLALVTGVLLRVFVL